MMLSDFPLWPEQASSVAGQTDALFIFMCVVTGTVSLLTFVVIFWLALRYRRTPENELAQDYEPPKALEITWIVVPFIIFMVMFAWGSWLYFRIARVPDNALDVYATGKYSRSAMNFVRAGGVATVLGLGSFIVIMIRKERQQR